MVGEIILVRNKNENKNSFYSVVWLEVERNRKIISFHYLSEIICIKMKKKIWINDYDINGWKKITQILYIIILLKKLNKNNFYSILYKLIFVTQK